MLAGATDVSICRGHRFSGLRERLRDATADAHRDLDAQLTAFDLTEFSGYRRFLQASAAAVLPLEAALTDGGVAEVFPDWPDRSRSQAIEADLARLGSTPQSAIKVPPLTRNGVLGTMYVLEGSRLGAKFLLRMVSDAVDRRVAQATAYLDHGAGKRLWQSFLHRLDVEELTERDGAEAIDAARGAFAIFERAADRA
jgi:heme oxygenase